MSGYSTIFKTVPLFKRNTNLTAIFAKEGINIITNHFARTQNNNDEHIYHYFETNISAQEMPNVGNKLFSRKIIGDIRFPNGYKWEDLAVVPALIARSEKFYFINRPVYSYRIGLNNTSVKDALFANDIFQFFEVYEMLKDNLGDTAPLYNEELKKLYAVHGSLKYLISSLWLNITPNEKGQIFRDYITLMEKIDSTYKDNDFYKKYTSSFSKKFYKNMFHF